MVYWEGIDDRIMRMSGCGHEKKIIDNPGFYSHWIEGELKVICPYCGLHNNDIIILKKSKNG